MSKGADDFLVEFDDPRGGRFSTGRARRRLQDDIERSVSAAYQPASPESSFGDESKSIKIKNMVDEAFKASIEILSKLDNMSQVGDNALAKNGLTVDVERKMNTYKSLLQNQGSEAFFNVLLGDIVSATRVAKTNEILAKDNADLNAAILFSKDIATRKQAECIDTLKEMVYQSVELSEKKENEALDWKKKHDLLVIQNNVNNNKVKALENRIQELQEKFEELSKEERIRQCKMDHTALELEEKIKKLKSLNDENMTLKEKVQEITKKYDQRTEEVVQMDTELRKKLECITTMTNRFENRVNEIYNTTEKKANDHIQMTVKTLEEKHQFQTKELTQKYEHLENENNMKLRRIEELTRMNESLNEKISELRANALQTERYAKAKCLRKVMSAITDNVSDSASECSDTMYSMFGKNDRRHRAFSDNSSGKRVAFGNPLATTPSPRKKQPK